MDVPRSAARLAAAALLIGLPVLRFIVSGVDGHQPSWLPLKREHKLSCWEVDGEKPPAGDSDKCLREKTTFPSTAGFG